MSKLSSYGILRCAVCLSTLPLKTTSPAARGRLRIAWRLACPCLLSAQPLTLDPGMGLAACSAIYQDIYRAAGVRQIREGALAVAVNLQAKSCHDWKSASCHITAQTVRGGPDLPRCCPGHSACDGRGGVCHARCSSGRTSAYITVVLLTAPASLGGIVAGRRTVVDSAGVAGAIGAT